MKECEGCILDGRRLPSCAFIRSAHALQEVKHRVWGELPSIGKKFIPEPDKALDQCSLKNEIEGE